MSTTGIPREDASSRADITWAEPAGETTSAFTPRRTWSSRIETCWSTLISRSGATIVSFTPGLSAAPALAPSAIVSQNSLSIALVTSAIVTSSLPRLHAPAARPASSAAAILLVKASLPPSRFPPHALPQHVDAHRGHDHGADHDHLPVRGHVEQVEAIAQEADDEGADQRPPRGADA